MNKREFMKYIDLLVTRSEHLIITKTKKEAIDVLKSISALAQNTILVLESEDN